MQTNYLTTDNNNNKNNNATCGNKLLSTEFKQ